MYSCPNGNQVINGSGANSRQPTMVEVLDFLAMSTKEVGNALRELFQGADLDGDGFLDQNEFVQLLRYSPQDEDGLVVLIAL